MIRLEEALAALVPTLRSGRGQTFLGEDPVEIARLLLGRPDRAALLAFWRKEEAWENLRGLLPADTLKALGHLIYNSQDGDRNLANAQVDLNLLFRDSRAAAFHLSRLRERGLLFYRVVNGPEGEQYLKVTIPTEVVQAYARHLRGPIPPEPSAIRPETDPGLRFYSNTLGFLGQIGLGLPVTKELRPTKAIIKALEHSLLPLPLEAWPDLAEPELPQSLLLWHYLRRQEMFRIQGKEAIPGPGLPTWLDLSPLEMASRVWEEISGEMAWPFPSLWLWERLQAWRKREWIPWETLFSGLDKVYGPEVETSADRRFLRWLLLLGLLRTGRDASGRRHIGWTTLGRGFLGEKVGLTWAESFLLQPTFEILAPLHLSPRRRWALAALTEPEGGDPMLSWKVTARSIRQAVHLGWTAEEVFAFLEEGSESPVPENVRATLKDWLASAEEPVVFDVPVLALPSERLAARLRGTAAIRKLLGPELSPTHFFVPRGNLPALRRAVLAAGYQMPEATRGLDETTASASPLAPGWAAAAPRPDRPRSRAGPRPLLTQVEFPKLRNGYLQPRKLSNYDLRLFLREAAAGSWLLRLETVSGSRQGILLPPADRDFWDPVYRLLTEQGPAELRVEGIRSVQVLVNEGK